MPSEAARELLIRRRARIDPCAYARAIEVPGRPVKPGDEDAQFFERVETPLARHHELLLEAMERVSQTKHGRLMVFMPPGGAKSTYASVVFPSRYLGKRPGSRIILASYGADLARKMGRRTRSILQQPRYKGIWGCQLSQFSRAAEQFLLTNGSEYMAAGLLSGITGNRADGIIIDDPVKGREDADSPVSRSKTWDAYNDDLKTRLLPGGWIVLVQTRWHEDDLAGRILPAGWNGESGTFKCTDGFNWEVISIQARCEVENDPLGRAEGDYFWPEWFDRAHWAQFEGMPRTWQSLYQQRPRPLEGALFKPDAVQVLDAPPAGLEWVRAWDLGATADGGDPTVGVLLGMWDEKPVIADVVRFQGSPDEVERVIVATASRDGRNVPIHLPQDPGQAGKAQIQYLTRKLAGYRVVSSPETGDKVTRAEPLASQVNVGNCYLVRGEWNRDFIDELRVFPNGAHDDQVDAASRAFAAFVMPNNLGLLDYYRQQAARLKAEKPA